MTNLRSPRASAPLVGRERWLVGQSAILAHDVPLGPLPDRPGWTVVLRAGATVRVYLQSGADVQCWVAGIAGIFRVPASALAEDRRDPRRPATDLVRSE